MDKKLSYLRYIPLYGTIIVIFVLFVKAVKKELNYSKFMKLFFKIGFMTAGIILPLQLLLIVINNYVIRISLPIIFLVTIFLGGYLMNYFAFKMINKKYNELL